MELVSPEQMRQIDHATIHDIGIAGIVLMERAAMGAVDAMLEHFGEGVRRVGILCGGGNNGGDGLAMTRMLTHRNIEVVLVTLSDPDGYTGDAQRNWEVLQELEQTVHQLHDVDENELVDRLLALPSCDIWCDAMLGTGLDRPVEGRYARAIEFINDREAVFALDVPSGLDAMTGQPLGLAVEAHACATFASPKLGQALYPGRAYCGELYVIDIGIPRRVIEQVGISAELITEEWMRHYLFTRDETSHKGDAGKILLLAGSHEMTGAAIITARGALLGGAGLVTVGTTSEVVPRIAVAVPEVMAAEVIATDEFEDHHRRALQEQLDRADVIAVGPGLGQRESLRDLLEHLLLDPRQPLVLDADALNLVSAWDLHESLRRGSMRRPIVLTPHPGEMARLAEVPISDILDEPVKHAQDLAKVTQCVVVLKMASTIIAAPDGRLGINTSGNEGMAAAGSGDALTGILAAQMPEHDDAFISACLAVWLHGAAGDACRATHGVRATTATRLLDHLSDVLTRVER